MKPSELDPRIKDLLFSRGYKTEKEIETFLNPNLSLLHDPFLLRGMKEAKERIERAINLKEKIVIYGDYDCDGISACVILYKFFKKKGIDCDVYIPDRFDDGYGLSFELIDEVVEKSKPNLIITVDLGVTAAKEVEKVKSYGVDIIVTDHHEPAEIIPSCIVIDPKVEGQDYPFNGLCGAGVALKVVEAIDGKDEAEKYFDVCAIATIGDIVPLTDENRLIAKKGKEKINSGKGLKSISYMLSMLGLKKLSSSDITFKIVPRLNASGRMSKGKKVFNFLIEEDEENLKKLFEDMAEDNEERLDSISLGVELLEKQIEKINFQTDNIILLRGEFHQGVLGILASRVCHDYNRPAIVFTKTEDGNLKGSGRSLDGIDLHQALENCSDLLVRFGGHKMAIGVELKEENFEAFRKEISKQIKKQANDKCFLLGEQYDIEVTEDDISENFINMLNYLEPFGCKNEKPILMLQTEDLKVNQMKDASFRHFKVITKTGKSIVAFSADKHVEALKSKCKKHLIIELENNEFRGKTYPQAILKNVFIKEISLKENKENEVITSLINRFLSEGAFKNVEFFEPSELENLLARLGNNLFGTLVVVDAKKDAARIKNLQNKLSNYEISHTLLKNRQNTILISSKGVLTKEEVLGYNNIVFLRQLFSHEKEIFSKVAKVYVMKCPARADFKLDKSRETQIYVYSLLKKYAMNIKANNVFEWLEKMKAAEGGMDKIQTMFSTLAFIELGFVRMTFDNFMVEMVENPPKRELSSSKIMNKLT